MIEGWERAHSLAFSKHYLMISTDINNDNKLLVKKREKEIKREREREREKAREKARERETDRRHFVFLG